MSATSPAGAAGRPGLWTRGFVVLSGTVSSALWKLAAMWAIARWLGPVTQGAFSLAVAGMSFGGVLAVLGLDYANAFLVGRNATRLASACRNTAWVAAVSFVFTPFWMWGFTAVFPQTVSGLGPLSPTAVVVMGASVSAMALAQGLMAAAFGRQRYDIVAKVNFVTGALWAAGALLVAVQASYLAVLIAWALSQLLSVGLYVWMLAPTGAGTLVDRPLLREQLGFGLRTLPGSAARAMNMRIGLYLTTFYLPRADVGVYGLLLQLAETLLYLPTALSQVILGSSAARAHTAAELRGVYVAVGVAGVAVAVGVVLFGSDALEMVFGPAYARGGPVLAVLVSAVVVYAVGLLTIHRLLGEGNPMAATIAQIIGLILTVVAGVILIPRFGMLGAASATFASYAGFTAYLSVRAIRADGAPRP